MISRSSFIKLRILLDLAISIIFVEFCKNSNTGNLGYALKETLPEKLLTDCLLHFTIDCSLHCLFRTINFKHD